MSGYDVCKHGRIRCVECTYVEELEDRIEELEQQNKRYREALERIQKNYPVLDADYVPVEMIYEIQLIISEALEGEK